MLTLVKTRRFSVLEVARGGFLPSREEPERLCALGGRIDADDDESLGFFGGDAPLSDSAMQVGCSLLPREATAPTISHMSPMSHLNLF